jgi:predicted AlkP superfamily phosphohydrolase/phosphomutase
MIIQANGVLKDWLTEKGYLHFASEPFEVDDAELTGLLEEANLAHSDYSSEKRHAWAVYSIITRNQIPASETDRIQNTAAAHAMLGDMARISSAHSHLAKEHFAKLSNTIANESQAVREVLQNAIISVGTIEETRQALAIAMDRVATEYKATSESIVAALHDLHMPHKEWRLLWAWRILILLGVLASLWQR